LKVSFVDLEVEVDKGNFHNMDIVDVESAVLVDVVDNGFVLYC
jgi:hypothetical protein